MLGRLRGAPVKYGEATVQDLRSLARLQSRARCSLEISIYLRYCFLYEFCCFLSRQHIVYPVMHLSTVPKILAVAPLNYSDTSLYYVLRAFGQCDADLPVVKSPDLFQDCKSWTICEAIKLCIG